jgi:GMP synthase-like glutamine amidotransferase
VRVLSIVHERAAGSGVFAWAAREHRVELVEWIPALGRAAPAGDFDAVLVFGGATHADEELLFSWLGGEKELLRVLLAAGTPALGVCLGAQLLAEVAGGRVTRMPEAEIGWTRVQLSTSARPDPVLGGLPEQFEGFEWHSYEISLPTGAVALARSSACLQAFRLASVPWWGIQFHAEATGETIAGWIDDYRSDPDARRAQIDWQLLLAETRREIARWNELGAGICVRFLDLVASRGWRG